MERSDTRSASALRWLLFSAAPLENTQVESLCTAELHPKKSRPGLGWDTALRLQPPASASSSVSLRHPLPHWVTVPGILLLAHCGLKDRYKMRNAKGQSFCLSTKIKTNIYIFKF